MALLDAKSLNHIEVIPFESDDEDAEQEDAEQCEDRDQDNDDDWDSSNDAVYRPMKGLPGIGRRLD